MSTEEAVTEGLQEPVTQNTEAAEDAKRMLEEIEADEKARIEGVQLEDDDVSNGSKQAVAAQVPESAEVKDEDEVEEKGKSRYGRDDHRRADNRGSRGSGRGSRGGRFPKGRDNIKSNLIRDEKSDDQAAIRKQVEFYFSDSNLPMDTFLLDKVGGSENKPVELDIICSFKRMRHFEPREAIIAALKDSKMVKLVDDDTKVQRKQPLPRSTEEGVNGKDGKYDHVRVFEDKAMPRTVYVKGFGAEVPSTQFDIEAWFANFGPTNAVRLRRTDDKLFKSSVFAEFETQELAQKFLEQDPKPKYNDRELKIMSKKDYCEQKAQDIREGKIQPSRDRPRGHGGRGRGGKFNDRQRDREDDRDWRTRREEDRKNGFRNDRRRDRDSRDKRNSRDRRRSSIEKDDRGIPVVRTDDPQKARDDAIAKAQAAVESNEKKENETSAPNNGEAGAAGLGKKREREDDGTADEPGAKKVDVKAEA